jgi:hypothetical protein
MICENIELRKSNYFLTMSTKALLESLDQGQNDSQSGDEAGQGSLELRRSSVEGRAAGSRSHWRGSLDCAGHGRGSRRRLNRSRVCGSRVCGRNNGSSGGRNNDSSSRNRGRVRAALTAGND